MKTFMARLVLFAGVFAMLVVLVGPTTSAQDLRLSPTYGTAYLVSGFVPDPHMVRVVAGGPIHTTLGGVSAYVANRPDYRVMYTAGSFPLTFYVRSQADTTLLINLPDGTWIADDDSDGYPNPMIRLSNPPSGQYDIWVGTFGPNTAPAVLYVSELR
jgi:hypothetical protein